jgi:hypothetical protein
MAKKKLKKLPAMILSLSAGDSDSAPTFDPLTFWKEAAHAGTFHKGYQRIEITPRHLSHWERSYREMRQLGLSVPVPVEHTRDPERRRGEVVDMALRTNSRGLPALYAKVKFRDAEAAKLSGSGVSVYVPREVQTGAGRTFKSPVEHLAITDYPVIPDLEPFSQALSLSFADEDVSLEFPPSKDEGSGKPPTTGQPPQQGGQPEVTLQSIAQALGIPPGTTDEKQLLAAIMQAVTAMRAQQRPMTPQQPQMMPQRPPMPPAYGARPPMAMALAQIPQEALMAMSKKQFKKLSKELSRVPTRDDSGRDLTDDTDLDDAGLGGLGDRPVALSGTVLGAVKTGRKTVVDGLFARGLVTAHARKQLEADYVDGQGVAFSHQYDDGFDRVVKLLEGNGRVLNAGKTGPQGGVALSKGGPEESNPLLADAERRAAGESNL